MNKKVELFAAWVCSKHAVAYEGGGKKSLMNKIFRKIRRFVYYQKILIYSFDVKKGHEYFRAKIPLWIGTPTLDELKELDADKEMDLRVYPWKYLKEKVENHLWKCVIAKSENRIVGYIFYSLSEMSFAGSKKIEFNLPHYAGYPFRLFVHPGFRNLQIGKQLEQEADERIKESKQDGVAIAFRATNSTNKIQLHNYEKLGGKFIGSVTFLQSRFFNTAIISRGIKRAGLTIKKA